MERLALDLQQGLLMGRIEHLLMPVIATAWRAISCVPSRIRMAESEATRVSVRPTACGGME